MNWLIRTSSDKNRVAHNVERLEELRKIIHELALFVVASQSGGFNVLKDLLSHRLVLGRPKVHQKLQQALIGENNQKVALDAPMRFQRMLFEAEELVKREIGNERRTLRKLTS